MLIFLTNQYIVQQALFIKWLLIMYSFVSVEIGLTSLIFELLIQKKFYSQTTLVRLPVI